MKITLLILALLLLFPQRVNANPAAEELDILHRIVWAEARGEDTKGQILVVNVIFNRLNCPNFPDTIQGAVFQPNQFAPVRDGSFNRATPCESIKYSVQQALSGVDHSRGALFFRTTQGSAGSWHERALQRLFTHGSHHFYTFKLRESDINLEVALALRPLLEREGFEILMSRTADVFVNINSRWQTANNWNADLFISIHTNAGGGTGVEVLIPTASPNNLSRDLNANRRLAKDMAEALATPFGMRLRRNNGVMLETETRHGSIGVLRNTRMLAIMPELAFIDSPLSNPDVGVLRNRRQELAAAPAKGVFDFLGIDLQQNTNTSAKENIMQEKRYNTIDEVPDRARPTIQKLIDKGALAGTGAGFNLSLDILRIFVIHDRMGGLFISGKFSTSKLLSIKGKNTLLPPLQIIL